MSLEKFLNIIQDFVSKPSVQAVFACLTILLAFISCVLTYKLSRPRIKIKSFKNSDFKGGYDATFAYGKSGPLATVTLSFENFTSHRTQIKDVYFTYKGKSYPAANDFTDYSQAKRYPSLNSSSEFPLKKEKLFSYVPFALDSFQYKKLFFTFYDFPEIKEETIFCPIFISIAGKKAIKFKFITFSKVDIDNLIYELTGKKNGISYKIQSNVPLRDKKGRIISKKR